MSFISFSSTFTQDKMTHIVLELLLSFCFLLRTTISSSLVVEFDLQITAVECKHTQLDLTGPEAKNNLRAGADRLALNGYISVWAVV